ncbi:type II toxin-antitoxin system HicB family antitoxin [Clostridium perfringens]|uniref:type II toxin-antitoxin system HicB family antitoxin n=1 Tax=Clostridium perfringens TaxID=1502 RepID=UPI0013E2D36C|nr:type II toxin-antitoxin system HicB family antitoxin [Clostridium perfringens]ELC8399248.1 type II toxin-antitoxin system HicB family antitoxin [Clostridium perfringens]NGT67327.1 type II toxin-antitoxin system HicB family antitoxin [Clostridium perfringens]
MKKKDTYIFPAIVTTENDGITINFPDLEGCITCAYSDDEIMKVSKEALELHLYGLETDEEIEGKELIPVPSKLNDLKLEKNQATTLVEVYMPVIRQVLDNKAVKKTVTIPNWLDVQAKKYEINFSQLLQEAIRNLLQL